jgi:hypothetical protein
VCFGLGSRGKHTLQGNPILQARILTLGGSSSTLGVDNTFGEVRPSLGRRRGPKISTPKDGVITKPGPLLQGLPRESGSGKRLGWSPRGLGRLSTADIGPTRGLGRSIPASVPLTGNPARLRPTRSSFRANSASVHADTATPGLGSSKGGQGVPLTEQEKPRATRPTEPRDPYASGIRVPHSSPLHGATHTW